MDGTTVWMWILSALFTVLGTVIAVVWSLLREESKSHSEAISKKADQKNLTDAEQRWTSEVDRLREENNRLIDKVDERYQRELEQMEVRLSTKIETMEVSVMRQMNLILEILRGK